MDKNVFKDVPVGEGFTAQSLEERAQLKVTDVLLHNIIVCANPRSGSRDAAKFIDRDGTDSQILMSS